MVATDGWAAIPKKGSRIVKRAITLAQEGIGIQREKTGTFRGAMKIEVVRAWPDFYQLLSWGWKPGFLLTRRL